jgi:hypothetical protein
MHHRKMLMMMVTTRSPNWLLTAAISKEEVGYNLNSFCFAA